MQAGEKQEIYSPLKGYSASDVVTSESNQTTKFSQLFDSNTNSQGGCKRERDGERTHTTRIKPLFFFLPCDLLSHPLTHLLSLSLSLFRSHSSASARENFLANARLCPNLFLIQTIIEAAGGYLPCDPIECRMFVKAPYCLSIDHKSHVTLLWKNSNLSWLLFFTPSYKVEMVVKYKYKVSLVISSLVTRSPIYTVIRAMESPHLCPFHWVSLSLSLTHTHT